MVALSRMLDPCGRATIHTIGKVDIPGKAPGKLGYFMKGKGVQMSPEVSRDGST